MSNEKKQLTPLFIEDLGQVQGGKKITTLALGEEDPITTLAIGEECGGSTILGGEEATTLALGEEGPGLPTS